MRCIDMQYVLFTRRRPCSKIYSPSLLIIRCAVLPCPSMYIRTHAHASCTSQPLERILPWDCLFPSLLYAAVLCKWQIQPMVYGSSLLVLGGESRRTAKENQALDISSSSILATPKCTSDAPAHASAYARACLFSRRPFMLCMACSFLLQNSVLTLFSFFSITIFNRPHKGY